MAREELRQILTQAKANGATPQQLEAYAKSYAEQAAIRPAQRDGTPAPEQRPAGQYAPLSSNLKAVGDVVNAYHGAFPQILDEGYGLVKGAQSALTGGDFGSGYSQGAQQVRDLEAAYEQQFPTRAVATNLAGLGAGMATALPAKAAGVAMKLPQMMAQGFKTAAPVGFVYGAAASGGDENAGFLESAANRVGSGLAGGFTGGVLGGAIPAMVQGGQYLKRTVGNLLGIGNPVEKAQRIASEILNQSGYSPQKIAGALLSAQKAGKPMALADVAGENARTIGATALQYPGPAQGIKQQLIERQAAQQGRIQSDISKMAGIPEGANIYKQSDEILSEASKAAKPFYDEVHKKSVPPNANFLRGQYGPDITAAIGEARSTFKGELAGLKDNSVKVLDYAKQKLDDKVSAAIRSGDNNAARYFSKVAKNLRESVDSYFPKYAEGRNVYATEASLNSAMELGRNLGYGRATAASEAGLDAGRGIDVDLINYLKQGLTKPELEAMQSGFAQALRQSVGGMTGDAAKKLTASQNMQDALSAIYGKNSKALNNFLRQIGQEESMAATTAAARNVSPTFKFAKGAELIEGAPPVTSLGGLLGRIGTDALKNRATGYNQETAGVLAQMLMQPDAQKAMAAFQSLQGWQRQQLAKQLSQQTQLPVYGMGLSSQISNAIGTNQQLKD